MDKLVENPSEEVQILAFDIKSSNSDELANCIVKFLDQITPLLTYSNVSNKTIIKGFIVGLNTKKTSVNSILNLSCGTQLIKNMLENSDTYYYVYEYLTDVVNSKFGKISTQFADVFDMYFLDKLPSVKKLARIMWTQTDENQIKKDLHLVENSCWVIESCVDEISKGTPFANHLLVTLALRCVMEAMMWCTTYHEIDRNTVQYIGSNVLTSIWSKIPAMILKTKDAKNYHLCELMKSRGGNFVEVLRGVSTRYISIDADTCLMLNSIFRKPPVSATDKGGMYYSSIILGDFKQR